MSSSASSTDSNSNQSPVVLESTTNSFTLSVIENFLIFNSEIIPESPDALFVSFEPNSGTSSYRGFNSSIKYGRILYKLSNGELKRSVSLFFKIFQNLSFYPHLQICFHTNESFFFTKAMAYFDSPVQQFAMSPIETLFPKFYACHVSLTNAAPCGDHGVMVLGNLESSGFQNSCKTSHLDYDHLALMMYKLGQFHSYSYAARAQSTEAVRNFLVLADSFVRIPFFPFNYLKRWGHRGLISLRQSCPSDIMAKLETRLENTEDEYMDILMRNHRANPIAVLCHGDFTTMNVMFKYDEDGKPVDLKMIDMANCRLSTPTTDIGNLFMLHCDQKMKDDHWDDLMQEYVRGLRSTFPNSLPPAQVKMPTVEQVMDQMKDEWLMPYVNACLVVPYRILLDKGVTWSEMVSPEYATTHFTQWPEKVFEKLTLRNGGEPGDNACAEMLLDVHKRGYII